MTVNRVALFEVTKSLWPETINLTQDPAGTHDIYWTLEKSVRSDDDWQQIAMWSFHQAFGELEQQASIDRVSVISPHAVSFADFDRCMRGNLAGDKCWAAERVLWENDTEMKH